MLGDVRPGTSKGWLSEVAPVNNFNRQRTILSPRFCIDEQHGAQEPKFRVMGDLPLPLVKAAVALDDTYFPPRFGHLHGLGSTTQHIWGYRHTNAVGRLSSAYKTSGQNTKSIDASYNCLANHSANRPSTANVLAQPFGSRRGAANLGRW